MREGGENEHASVSSAVLAGDELSEEATSEEGEDAGDGQLFVFVECDGRGVFAVSKDLTYIEHMRVGLGSVWKGHQGEGGRGDGPRAMPI